MMKYYENFKNAGSELDVRYNGYEKTLEEIGRINGASKFELGRMDVYTNIIIPDEHNSYDINILAETKYKSNLLDKAERNKAFAQVINYLHNVILKNQDGIKFPDVIILCNNKNFIITKSSTLDPFINENYNFNLKASYMSDDLNLMNDLRDKLNEKDITTLYIETNTDSDLREAIIKAYKEMEYKTDITKVSIVNVAKQYAPMILEGKYVTSSNDKNGIIIDIIGDSDNNYQDPNNKNILITSRGKVSIDPKLFKEFKEKNNLNLKPSDINAIIAARDVLIENGERREKGQFYTPPIWAQHANNLCEKHFGENYRQEYVTWDCCSGTKNLTRDNDDWKELYCSSLEETEITNSKNFNINSTSFAFDFLDGDRTELVKKAPGLLYALRNDKPILFLINPPYGTGVDSKIGKGNSKEGINKRSDKTLEEFKDAGFNFSCENIYMQFLERICWYKKQYNLTNVNICLFSPITHLTGAKQKQFRKIFFKYFNFEYGCKFNAGEFQGTASNWDISLSIYNSNVNNKKLNDSFKYDNVYYNGSVIVKNSEVLKNSDYSKGIKEWLRESDCKRAVFAAPSFSTGIVNKSLNSRASMMKGGCFGYLVDNPTGRSGTLITSCGSGNANGKHIYKDNFEKIITTFLVRKCSKSTDAVLAPDETNPKWKQFVNDCLIFTIFDNGNNATSLKNVNYQPPKNIATISDSPNVHYNGNGLWTINNPWLSLSKDEIAESADKYSLNNTRNEAMNGKNSFVYDWMQGKTFSSEAQKVLDLGNDLIKKSFEFRKKFDDENPEYQIMNWDCGWYQVKKLVKEYLSDDYKKFEEVFAELKSFLANQIYDLGFLEKD